MSLGSLETVTISFLNPAVQPSDPEQEQDCFWSIARRCEPSIVHGQDMLLPCAHSSHRSLLESKHALTPIMLARSEAGVCRNSMANEE